LEVEEALEAARKEKNGEVQEKRNLSDMRIKFREKKSLGQEKKRLWQTKSKCPKIREVQQLG